MEALFFYLFPNITNHLESIQFHIKFHFCHFYLFNHVRSLHLLPLFKCIYDKIMAFCIIPMLLTFSKSKIIGIFIYLRLVISMELLIFGYSWISLKNCLWSFGVVEGLDVYLGGLLFNYIIKFIIIRFGIGVLLFFDSFCVLSFHLLCMVTIADGVFALCWELSVW